MSARPKRTKATKSYREPESEEDNDSDYKEKNEPPEPSASTSTSAPRGRKRAAPKATGSEKPTKRRKTGRLEAVLKELPTELVFTVFSYLDPQTLINLSRTNQYFRNTLLSSDLFWKTARLGAGMPDLEAQDITERQYILLVFDKNCHGAKCERRNVQEINFVNCARLCSPCRAKTRVTKAARRQLMKTLHPMAEVCAKYTDDSGRRIPRGIVKLSKKFYTLQGAELDNFVAERRLLKEQIERDATSIQSWLVDLTFEKYDEYIANQSSREDSIKEKLLALGWTDLTLPTTWNCRREVYQPRKLTPRIWKTIEVSLVKDLRNDLIKHRNRLRRDALAAQYSELLQEDSQPDLFPSRSAFLELPSVEPLWKKNTGPDPPSVELQPFSAFVEAEWLAALAAIRDDITRYQQSMTDLAVERLTSAYVAKGLPVPDSPIDDPRSYFCYKAAYDFLQEGNIILQFPAVHRAMRDRQDGRGVVFRDPVAAEFKTAPTSNSGHEETLNVELKDA